MIDYNKLFDVAYSDTLPEEVKVSVLDNVLESVGAELNESLNEKDSHYVEFIDMLVNSTISETSLNDILDMTFGNLSEEVINEVSDAYINRAAKNALKQRQTTVKKQQDYGNRPIGLKGVERQAKEIDRAKHAEQMTTYKQPNKPAQQAQPAAATKANGSPIGLAGIRKQGQAQPQAQQPAQPKAQAQTKPSAMDRLKSAVGKVKSWVDNVRKSNEKPTGLAKLKQEKEERINKAVEMGTGPKAEKKAETKTAEPAKEAPKATANKKTTAKKDSKGEQLKLEVEAPKAEKKTTTKKSNSKKIAQAQKEAEKVEQPKAEEAPKPKATPKKKTTTATKKKLDATTKKVTAEVTNAETKKPAAKKTTKKKVAVKKAKPKNASEALVSFIDLLTDTNISEAAFLNVVEMISNKKAAEKAVERDYKEFSNAADALNHLEVVKAKTGSYPVSDEQHKKMIEDAAKKGSRYETFKALADKKFG